jgi:uncharacterized membrane protein
MSDIFTWKMTKDQCRDTGMAMVLILLIAFIFTKQINCIYGAIAVHVLNMVFPVIFRPLAMIWFGLTHILGTIVSKVLLSIVFFFVVTPVGVIRKILGKDTLQLKAFKSGKESAMVQRNHTFTAGDIEKPY